MVLKKFKEKSVFKIIKKRLNTLTEISPIENEKIKSLLVIIDYDKTTDIKFFEDLSKKMGVRQEAYRIIGYQNRIEKNENYEMPVFNMKTLGWNGVLSNPELDDILKGKYDLLINFYKKSNLSLQFMSSMANAGFRMGIGNENTDFNHLVIESDVNNLPEFKKELIKYLSILNKI